MRKLLAMIVLASAAGVGESQEGKPKTVQEPAARFGVAFKGKAFPQATPKEALESLVEAADKGEFSYLVAHLLEPSFVDARVNDRAKQFESQVAANLAALRDFQQKNLDKVDRESRVPTDAAKFQERVLADARAAAFKQLAKDVQEKFLEDPETLKAMKLFRSSGTFPDMAGDVVKVGHPEVKDRSLFIKKIDGRYFLENRQADAPEPPKEPEKK